MENDSALDTTLTSTINEPVWSPAPEAVTQPTAALGHPALFTWDGARRGSIIAFPLALGVTIYGFSFGALAHQKSFDLLQTMAMSMTVFSSVAQFMTLDIWQSPLPLFTLILTIFLLNLRYVVMGAALYPSFQQLPWYKTNPALFFLIDESWALSFQNMLRGNKDGAFLLGSGLTIYLAWISSTYAGYVFSQLIQNPKALGLDFVNILVFITLACKANRSTKIAVLPLLGAALGAILASLYLPGKWYVIIGGLLGSLIGMMIHGMGKD